jgi:DNA transposition AAA+ family ATPase
MPEPAPEAREREPEFLVTKEYRRFAEFADACRRERYIGLCHGAPGVGKTISARHYAHWDEISLHLTREAIEERAIDQALYETPDALAMSRAVIWTPTVTITPRRLEQQVPRLCGLFSRLVEHHEAAAEHRYPNRDPFHVELLIVDEADRLKTTALEQLRDYFDRHDIGLILIGMPGLERKLARYPQLYRRIGFAHRYTPLSPDELRFVLSRHWERLGLTLSADDFADAEAIAAVARITGGNFRLVHRLFAQISRLIEINQLSTVTSEVVEAARETLVIGTNSLRHLEPADRRHLAIKVTGGAPPDSCERRPIGPSFWPPGARAGPPGVLASRRCSDPSRLPTAPDQPAPAQPAPAQPAPGWPPSS